MKNKAFMYVNVDRKSRLIIMVILLKTKNVFFTPLVVLFFMLFCLLCYKLLKVEWKIKKL